MSSILWKLKGGDRRSIGRSNEVVGNVLDDGALFKEVFRGLSDDDALVRIRAADAAEKITAIRPEHLKPFKKQLLYEVAMSEQAEVRWHVAQMLPRLTLSADEQALAVEILLSYLNDASRIVKTSALQALTDFAQRDSRLQEPVIDLLTEVLESGSPAMKARGRKLLARLRKQSVPRTASPNTNRRGAKRSVT
jgi:HEAT repeat protein